MTTKKIITLSTILLLLGLCMGVNAKTTETINGKEFTLVGSADEFVSAWGAHKNIKLTDDIDLSGRAREMSNGSYSVNEESMEITGYYSIDYNGEITGSKDHYNVNKDKPYYELKGIDYMLWSDISNLTLNHVIISSSSYKLFHKTKNCTFNEVIFEKCSKMNSHTDAQGFVADEDEGSQFTNLLFVGCKLYGKSDVGLICGYKSGGSIDNCFVTSTNVIYGQDGNVGSLIGSGSSVTITNSISSATVSGYGDRIGGIVGNVGGGEIKNCIFYGMVKDADMTASEFSQSVSSSPLAAGYASIKAALGVSKAITAVKDYNKMYSLMCLTAGDVIDYTEGINLLSEGLTSSVIMGCVEGVANLTDCVTTFVTGTEFVTSASTIFAVGTTIEVAWYVWGLYSLGSTIWDIVSNITGPGQVGGIAGYCENGTTLSCCSNYGMVYCVDNSCGGIVGLGKSVNIISCLNHGAVHGDEHTAGIAGTMEDGSVKTSLNIGSVSCNQTESGGRICGHTVGTTQSYNCYSDLESDLGDNSNTGNLRVSQLDLVSGKAAAFLNKKCAGDSCWHQVVGLDHWPNLIPTHKLAKKKDIDTSLSTTVQAYDKISLITAMVNPYSDINIIKDVDFENYPAFNLSSAYMPFRGTIKGNGHRISNISFVQDGKTYTLWGLEGLWNKTQNVGILGCAKNATFSDIILENISLGKGGTSMKNASLFVANSENCTYDNIHLTGNSYIGPKDSSGPDVYNVGGIVGLSKNDTLNNCSIGNLCVLHTDKANFHDACLGGIAGSADGSTFNQCWNAAEIFCNNNYIGGIVGSASNVKMTRCLNTGEVSGAVGTGGLIGLMTNRSTMSYCSEASVVTGYIYEDAECIPYYSVALLVGEAHDGSSIDHCLSFGEVGPTLAMYDAILGQKSDDVNVTYTYYKNKKNSLTDHASYCNLGTLYPQGIVKTDAAKDSIILRGPLVDLLNEASLDTVWYQDIDNNIFPTRYPVPIPDAGKVYTDFLCNGNLTYSNRYNNPQVGTHRTNLDKFGLCTICGNIGTPGSEIKLKGADDMRSLAYATNRGQDFSKSFISLTTDADMGGQQCAPIGTKAHPFSVGIFDGEGHHVKNMNIETSDCAGLFGRVKNGHIRNIVVDSTCVIRSTALAAAGIVGSASATEGEKVSVTLKCCGNEATVYAPLNAAGLLGGVYNDNDISISINDCYNTGSIFGQKESAALVGWGNRNLQIDLCFNTGVVRGYDSGHYLMRFNYDYSNTTISIGAIYQPEGFPADDKSDVKKLSPLRFTNGYLAGLLRNNGSNLWGQNLGTDAYPRFSSGIYHQRSMPDTWGTILLPFDVKSDSSIQYYELDSCDTKGEVGNIYLKPIDKLERNLPAFFKKLDANATKIKITDTSKATPDENEDCTYSSMYPHGWNITGKYSRQDSLLNVYYLKDDMVCYADTAVSVPAYSAYLYRTNSTGSHKCKSFNILVKEDGETTQVGTITADGKMTFGGQHIYTIGGQCATKPQSNNVYIVNGKKVLMR